MTAETNATTGASERSTWDAENWGDTLSPPRRGSRPARLVAQCSLCSMTLHVEHRHLLELTARQIVCACKPCAIRFANAIEGRFKLVPRDSCVLSSFRPVNALWESLPSSVDLCFFCFDSAAGKFIAVHPGAAGPCESPLPARAWQLLVERNPPLAHLLPDVRAILLHRLDPAQECFLTPIDLCFTLAGLTRAPSHQRSPRGADELHQFFEQLKARSQGVEMDFV